MLKVLLIAVVAIVAVVIIGIATQPAEFQVERVALISAPPEVVFEQVNDPHKFQDWSPWARMDPDSRITFAGTASGPGASFSWSGSKTGEGRMRIADSRPNQSINANLDFIKPFASSSSVEFDFEPKGEQTKVIWKMSAKVLSSRKRFT